MSLEEPPKPINTLEKCQTKLDKVCLMLCENCYNIKKLL